MKYRATLQTRTTLEQAGRIAGLAGDLNVSEADVTRRLIERALDQGGRQLLAELRREIHAELTAEREAREQAIVEHERQVEAGER